jgi:hypothetical protein
MRGMTDLVVLGRAAECLSPSVARFVETVARIVPDRGRFGGGPGRAVTLAVPAEGVGRWWEFGPVGLI